MKKRSISLLLCLVMIFSLLPFSAMAKIYPVTDEMGTVEIRFMNRDGTQASKQVVNKNGDTIAEGAIYDPGCKLGDKEIFDTWAFAEQTGDVEAIRQYLNNSDNWNNLPTEDGQKVLVVTARTKEVRFLAYYDENDRVLKTQSAVVEGNENPKVTVDLDYVSSKPGRDFQGWTTEKPDSEHPETANVTHHNGDQIALAGNVEYTKLYPVCKTGFWLTFDSNVDKNGSDPTEASYTPPQFVADGSNTVAPANPTRAGYRFVGWYTVEGDEQTDDKKFTFGGQLTEKTTVYAKWEPAAEQTKYTVVFWQQKATDAVDATDAQKTYDYYGSVERTAPTGEPVNITDADKQLSSAGLGTEVPAMGFYFEYNAGKTDAENENLTVKGDGSTVLNVYYDRKTITFNFDDAFVSTQYDYRQSNYGEYYYYWQISKSHFGQVNGQFVPLTLSGSESSGYINVNNASWTVTSTGEAYDGTILEPVSGDGFTPAANGSYYLYNDPYATGYYRIGDDRGPFKNGYTPANGTTLYYSKDGGDRSETLNSSEVAKFDYYKSSRPGYNTNYSVATNSNGTQPRNEGIYRYAGGLYYNCKDGAVFGIGGTWYFHPLYGYHEKQPSAYYAVGTGPDPTAVGTHNLASSAETFTGLYGAPFSSWPELSGDYCWGSDQSIYPLPLTQYVPSSNTGENLTEQTFYLSPFSGASKIYVIMQDLEGNYTQNIADCSSNGGTWYPTETFQGYTIAYYRLGNESAATRHPVSSPQDPIEANGQDIYLYYSRNKHTFKMESNSSTWKSDADVYYDAPLSVFANEVPTNGPEGRYFEGWYADPTCTTPFDFSAKMPDANVTVYANWVVKRYQIELVSPEGTDMHGQATSFDIEYNEEISGEKIENATLAGYQLVGWYTPDPEHPENHFYQRFMFDGTHVTDAIADTSYTDPNNSAIRGKVTLYAQWRKLLNGDEHITIVYDPGDGTINGEELYTDPLKYADKAEAVAQAGAKANAARTNFLEWEILDADGNPTGRTVGARNSFEVLLSDAKVGTATDENNNTYKTYTVTLRAKYVPGESTTHVTWVGNGGTVDGTPEGVSAVNSGEAALNVTIPIESANTFTRPGYEFVGWAILDEDEMKNEDGTWKQDDAKALAGLTLIPDETEANAWRVKQTNKKALGVAADNDTDESGKPIFHVMYAVWEKVEPNTYVIDFGAAMKVATNTEKMKGANTEGKLAGVNGEFALTSGKDVTYQLTKPKLQSTAGEVVEINKAYTAADTAVIKGKPMGKDAVGWNKITTVPASSIYFDDDLATLNVGDGSGNNAGVTASPAENDAAAGIYSYKFYGTGIDIYCTTNAAAGSVQARLKDANGNFMDGKNKAMYNHSETERYNVPTICYRDLEQGEYTVVLRVTANSHYRLDGIRVYNAVSDQSLYDDAKAEQYAAYVNLRDALINGTNTDKVTIDDSQAAVGVLFVDNPELFTQMVPEKDLQTGAIVKDENGNPKMVQAYSNTFLAYKDLGPKNEIYLDTAKAAVDADEANGIEAQPAKEGQAITFTLTPDAFAAAQAGQLWIGLSTPEAANGGVVAINGATNTITVKNQVDQYYKIEKEWIDSATRNVTIQNTGNTLIAITNLKITGVEKFYKAAAQTESSGNEGGAVPESFEDLVSMVFEPVTMQTIKVAANGGVDPDAVKDNWDDNAVTPQTILKALFELLLNSLSRLFNGLGNW